MSIYDVKVKWSQGDKYLASRLPKDCFSFKNIHMNLKLDGKTTVYSRSSSTLAFKYEAHFVQSLAISPVKQAG